MVGPHIAGDRVNLRPVCDEDLRRRTEWLCDPEVVRLFTGSPLERPYAITDAERWRVSLEADMTAKVWAIETKDNVHIGDVDLHEISRSDKSAKMTILIGDKASWDKGYGTDAIRTLLDHAFSKMGLENVSLKVYEFNERAIRCYEKCGFTRVGLIHEPTGGPAEIHMTVSKNEFMAKKSHAPIVQT